MLPLLVIFVKNIDHCIQMFFISQKIGISGIDENGFDVMLLYIMRICLLNIEQVFVGNRLFNRQVFRHDVRAGRSALL